MSKNQHNIATGSELNRSDERIKQTAEVFTPMQLVYDMIAEISVDVMKDKSKTFLDNSCGSGNFLVGLYSVLTTEYSHTHDEAISRLYGIDIMQDNIEETCRRLNVSCPHEHFVVGDGLINHFGPKPVDMLGLLSS